MSSARVLSSFLAVVIAIFAATANATLIVVSDASLPPGLSNSITFDKSTDGDTAAGIIATFSTNENVFPGGNSSAWNSTHSFLTPFNGSDPEDIGVATWTFTGLTDGDVFDVFVSWGSGQGNLASEAPYSINGGATITKNQINTSAAADLILDDSGDVPINFELLGQGTVDGLGNITISVTEPISGVIGFVKMDAVAISAVSAVPEVSAAIALPFVMGLVGFGKMSRRRR